jgi:hypothetical protein
MSTISKTFLTVGLFAAEVSAALERMKREGWECHAVENLQEAKKALETGDFGLALAAKDLADGSGYDLQGGVMRNGGSLFVAVTLSENYLWVPVVERGSKTPGECALEPRSLESELGKYACAYGVQSISSVPAGHTRGRKWKQAKALCQPTHQTGEPSSNLEVM